MLIYLSRDEIIKAVVEKYNLAGEKGLYAQFQIVQVEGFGSDEDEEEMDVSIELVIGDNEEEVNGAYGDHEGIRL